MKNKGLRGRREPARRLGYTPVTRRSGRVVEGGTLLRCYTSQRGIEGSNPSSSASKVPRLQAQREGEEKGWEQARSLLHQRVHQRSQNTLFCGHERCIGNLVFVSTATRSCGRVRGAAWPRSTIKRPSACSYAGCWIWTSENSPSTHSGE